MKPVRAPNGMRMGSFLDSIEHNTEGEKYIPATTLLTLIGFITDKPVKTVASYLRKTDFNQKVSSYYHLMDKKSYSKDMHKEAHGFDLNTKELLAECYHHFGFSEKYMTFKQAHELDFDFYYLKDELQDIDCLKDLNIDFSLEWEAERAQSEWDDEVEKPIFRLTDSIYLKTSDDEKVNGIKGLGFFRDNLIKYDSYSVVNAACLLSGDSPTEIHKFQDHLEFVQVFSEYLSFKLMIELAIKNGELTINDDKILAADLKEYLGKNGYFFKGFNDFMAIEPAKSLLGNQEPQADSNELADTQSKIAELEKQLSKAHADNDLLRKSIEDNKELEPNSIASVTCLLNVLFYKSGYDIKSHSGTTNAQIISYSNRPDVNTPISKGFLTPWIKRVQQLRIDTGTGSHDRHAPL